MEDNKNRTEKHELSLVYNEKLSLNCVKNVPSFNNNEVEVTLIDEKLIITGENMEIDKLDLENGTLTLTGLVKGINYASGNAKNRFLKRIFK